MIFTLITPATLADVWPYVKQGLERVREVGKIRWLAEEVYVALARQRALCFIGSDENGRRGFVVTELRNEPHSGERQLNCWIIWAEPTRGEHFADVAAFIPETMAFIDEHARRNNVKTITLEGREGWKKMLKDYFTPTVTKFERAVP